MDNQLNHHGIKGQKWGVRRYQNEDGTLIKNAKRVDKLAKRDSKKAADAKMFYGKTAGTKRKLLNAELNKKKKDIPGYEDAFNKHFKEADFAKSAKKAVTKRRRMDVTYRTRVSVKQFVGVTGSLTVAAAGVYYSRNKQQVDNAIATMMSKAFVKRM